MKVLYEMPQRQKRIWELQMSYSGTDICNIGGYLHLEGKYDVALWLKTIEIFLKCNSSFWMKINSDGYVYFDKIESYTMQEYDFSGMAEHKIDAVIQKWMSEPFTVYDNYLFDFRMLKVKEKILIFEKFHHCIADGYSVLLCAKYQEKIYGQLLAGKTEFDIDERYRKWISLQNIQVSKDLKKSGIENKENNGFVSFAKRALNPSAGILAGFITEGEYAPNTIEWYKKKFPYKRISQFCRKYRVSTEALFYGCMAMYLCRVTDADALPIGRNLLGRKGEEFNITGLNVQTRAIAVRPEWNRPAAEFLAGLKKKLAIHALGDEDCGAIPEIEISYRPARYLPAPSQGECREFYNSSVELPVKIFINEQRSGIELIVKYQKAAVSEQKVRRLMEKTLFFIDQILERPEQICGSLCLMQEDEKQWILSAQKGKDWNDSLSVPERFLIMARLYPDRKALVWENGCYTYREFYGLVQGIMDLIVKNVDADKESVIGLCLTRTPYLPAAVFAAWLSGYAFLPVSPRETKERLSAVTRHCALCLTEEMLKGITAEGNTARINMQLSCPAYEIYTSGTTGEPKAVKISHSSLSCRLEWMEDMFSDGTERILQKTRSIFDVSVWELALPFAFGKSLCLLEEGKESSAKAITETLVRENVTMVHFVPSMFERFLFYLESKKTDIPNLKYCILSGEELGAGLVRRAKKLLPQTQIFNLYGPTECTIDVSCYRCVGNEKQIPIGAAVYGTNLSVRNKRGELLPMGERGELVVEGSLVGMGYRGKEESGYAVLEKKRVYRTGDIAVLKNDGLLYYEGRKDAQVKLRGIRINLAEVERRLNQMVLGTRSVVCLAEDRLVAFYEGDKTPDMMKKEAAKHLSYYSVPSEFIFLKQLPLCENGKADREKLKRIYETKRRSKAAAMTFSSHWELARREKVLLYLAKKHLNREDITLDGNLMDFGMDSLTALSFLAECEAYGIFLPYSAVYETPFLRSLARESFRVGEGKKEKRKPLVFLRQNSGRRLLLVVPFAGGTPLSAFPLALQFQNGEVDVAAVNLSFFGGKDIEAGAEKVVSLKCLRKYKEIYLMGACVGSVLALQIAGLLGSRLRGLLLCEALPGQTDVWKCVTDTILVKALRKLRGKSFAAEREMLLRFREDVKKSTVYLRRMKKKKMNGNIVMVFGEEDLLTANYKKRVKKWHKWIAQPFRIYTVPGAKHFLMEDSPLLLAQIIRKEFLAE